MGASAGGRHGLGGVYRPAMGGRHGGAPKGLGGLGPDAQPVGRPVVAAGGVFGGSNGGWGCPHGGDWLGWGVFGQKRWGAAAVRGLGCGDGGTGRQFLEVADVWWVVLPETDRVRAMWGALSGCGWLRRRIADCGGSRGQRHGSGRGHRSIDALRWCVLVCFSRRQGGGSRH